MKTDKYNIRPYHTDTASKDMNERISDYEVEMALTMPKTGKPLTIGEAYFLRISMCAECLGIDKDGIEIYDFSAVNLPLPVWAAQNGYYIEVGEDEIIDFKTKAVA